jgi:cellulose synthase/poly-beta-1,6-N-acetylglucosamine synthase-like glycosyltransferase
LPLPTKSILKALAIRPLSSLQIKTQTQKQNSNLALPNPNTKKTTERLDRPKKHNKMLIFHILPIIFMIFHILKAAYTVLTSAPSFLLDPIKPYTKPFLKKHPIMTYSLVLFALALSVFGLSQIISNPFMLTVVCLSIFRYLRLVVNVLAFSCQVGHPVKKNPTFKPTDVSVVVPTVFADKNEVMDCLKRIRTCNPLQIIVVTADHLVSSVYAACAEVTASAESDDEKLDNVQVIGVAKLNKRTQMVAALQQAVTGSIVAFADDDVYWPGNDFITAMLACFENPEVGACGPSQRVCRSTDSKKLTSFTNFLGICYLERRNFYTGATNYIDGAVSTLSGRTSFYRASLIQNDAFYSYFMNALNHDDDKNLTRWVYDQGFQITLNFSPRARINTTLETSPMMFLNQCMRWARGHWRGNFRVMKTTTYWYDTHMWSLYAIYIGQFQTPAFLIDGSLLALLYRGMSDYDAYNRNFSVCLLAGWILFSKTIKMIPHFLEFPQDMVFIPGMICFSYYHGLMNVYALITMENKVWGR